ncbi:MAG: hypothetical protein K8R92_06425 [Planctomycetes bacterium]|nr:hypothetical protein [Planctomycetota bacterium]
MPRNLLIVIATLALAGCSAFDPPRPALPDTAVPAIDSVIASGSKEERLRMWREDIDAFEKILLSRHAGLYAVLPRERFEEEFASLRKDLPDLRDDQIVVRLQEIAASIGSGHTAVHTERGRLIPGRLPIGCAWLSDGVLIAAADDDNAAIRGARVIGVGDHGIDEVLVEIAKVTPHENEAFLRLNSMQPLCEAHTLSGLGLIDDPTAVPFHVRLRGGGETTVLLYPRRGGESFTITSGMDPGNICFTRLPRPGKRIYGTQYFEDRRALYIWYDSCSNAPDQSVAQFVKAALEEIDRLRPRVVVFDLRRNGGGNSGLLEPFIDGVREREWLNDHQRLAVLIGHGTFSSAGMNAEEFRSRTHATLIGEPTGQRPDSWMECRWDWLPNSLLRVNYMLYAPSFAKDKPDSCNPDILVPVSCDDWLSGRDLAFERALELVPAASLPSIP